MVGADIGLLGIYWLCSLALLAGPPLVSSSVRWRRRRLGLPSHGKDPTGSFSRAVSARPRARKASTKVCRMFLLSSARGRAPLLPVLLSLASLTHSQPRMTFLLTWGQRAIAASRYCTCRHHSPHFLTSRGLVVTSCPKKKGEDNTVRYFKRETTVTQHLSVCCYHSFLF